MVFLAVCLDRAFLAPLVLFVSVSVADFKESQVLRLAVHIAANAFQATKEKCLAHYAQVAR